MNGHALHGLAKAELDAEVLSSFQPGTPGLAKLQSNSSLHQLAMGKEDKGRPHAQGLHAERQRLLVELLDCPICLKTVASPQFLHCCGNLMCGLCLYGCLQKKNECPMCRKPGPQHSDHRFAQNVRQSLQQTGTTLPVGGMWIDKYGSTHEGCFKDGELHGQAKKTYANGSTHEGCFKDGKLHGQAKKTFADGGTHEGCFKDGELDGQGKKTFADGGKIEQGEYTGGVLHGQGQIIYANRQMCEAEMYDGCFKNGMFDGQGKLTYINGKMYEGCFRGGSFGHGKFTFPAGTVFEGCFNKYGQLHGPGKKIFRHTVYEGECKSHIVYEVYEGFFRCNRMVELHPGIVWML